MPNIALLFPGQGAQFLGMGKGLLERSEKARALFVTASEILGYDLGKLCVEGPEDQLHLTNHSQPALFVHSMAALADFLEQNPSILNSVVAVAGLSLGEYSALACANAISFEDGVRLVQQRGAAMQDAATAVPSGMASVLGLTSEQLVAVCNSARLPGEILQIANLLCPGNIAVSGHAASIDAVTVAAVSAGAMKTILLNVAGAFHTDIMKPAVERLGVALSSVKFFNARFPLFSNVDAQPHAMAEEFSPLLLKQVVSPVQWESTLRNMQSAGVDQFYEIGAGRVLAGTLKRVDRKAACDCFGD
ncbi:MAG: ACP S-malonyltransferase [Planctomycetota bacterium]|nr:ACP S-malonyltransferase [Planctomycetota bacterium]